MATRFYNFYGEKNLIEPRSQITLKAWRQIGDRILASEKPGIYRDAKSINRILHVAYSFVETKLSRLLRRLASREFLELILYQYDVAAGLWNAVPDSGSWRDLHRESHYASRRRALKYLAEQVTLRSPPEYAQVQRTNLMVEAEESILYADILVALYMMSDRSHYLFPEHSQLTLFEKYVVTPIRLDTLNPFEGAEVFFNSRMTRDRISRSSCFADFTAERNTAFQSKILDDIFSKEFGISYSEFLNVLIRIMIDITPAPGSYPIVFCHRENLVTEIASVAKIQPNIASRIVDGFTLRARDMRKEGRELWNVKQIFRAFRRGFFEIPQPAGLHLTWSKSMGEECLDWLVTGISFKKLPSEWFTEVVEESLNRLSHAASTWFEKQAVQHFSNLGIEGSRRKGRMQSGGCKIAIPPKVGEIDFLGYSPKDNAIVIAECKLVESRMEARFWKDDIYEFVNAKKSYAAKFRTKIKWLLENQNKVAKILTGYEVVSEVRAVMLTLYPTFASIHISDFPCVSLGELVADCKAAGKWPYQTGIFSVG